MEYIASPDRITFDLGGTFTTICREDNAYFDRLLNAIQSGQVFPERVLPCYLRNPHEVAELTDGKVYYQNGSFRSDAFPLPENLNRLLLEFLDKDLPVMPFLKLGEKLVANPAPELANAVAGFVADGDIPLSWDGNLVTYARSAWVPCQGSVEEWMESTFAPGKVMEGDDLITGTLEWTTQQCPDQGRVFDLLVEPQYIVGVDGGKLTCTRYTNISTLEETQEPEERVVLIHTEANPLGTSQGNVYMRSPFSDAQLSHYLSAALGNSTTVSKATPVAV